MARADEIYNSLVEDILDNGVWNTGEGGVRTKWADGTTAYAKSLYDVQLRFKPDEIPILTGKKVFERIARIEKDWIWKEKSNSLEKLREMNGSDKTVWNEWEIKEGKWKGTIGPAYGYVLGEKVLNLNGEKVDQVDYLIHQLKNNPASRRHVTTLWIPHYLDEMALNPCVWNTEWASVEGVLHLRVHSRSADVGLGLPFNIYQYAVLHREIAQVTGHGVGMMTFDIFNAHIYDRHVDSLKKQIHLPTYEAPGWELNLDINNFYDFTEHDFKLVDYQCGPAIKLPVAE